MATITGYTKAREQAIEDSSVVSGSVNVAGDLTLTRRDGGTIAAGNVKGPQGTFGAPPGVMLNYDGITVPSGYYACNGASLLRTAEPTLFAAIGTIYGAADSTHFYLPDSTGWRGVSTATTSIPQSAWTPVQGWTADTGYTTKSGKYYTYDPATGIFTMITPGVYNVFSEVTIDSATTRFLMRWMKNGAEEARNSHGEVQVVTGTATRTLAKQVKFAAGDTFQVLVWQSQNPSASMNLNPNPNHILELMPISLGDIIKS